MASDLCLHCNKKDSRLIRLNRYVQLSSEAKWPKFLLEPSCTQCKRYSHYYFLIIRVFDIYAYSTRAAVDGTPLQIPAFFTFDLYLRVKVTQNVTQYPLNHVTYAHANFEVATSNRLGAAFTRKYALYDLDTKYCPVGQFAEFEVAMSNSLGGKAFTRKYII